MTESAQRLEALKKLLDQCGSTVDEYAEEVEEDLRPYFNGERELERWACVTKHGDRHFFYSYAEVDAAQTRAEEYIHDSLYEETPVAVVDLDSGHRWLADLQVAWRYERLSPHQAEMIRRL